MKTYLKISIITIISFISFLILYGCANGIVALENTSTNDINAENTKITQETSEGISEEKQIEVFELTDDIKRRFDAVTDFYKDKTQEFYSEGGCVKDAETAGKIAAVLFEAVFIDELQDYELPLEIYYDEVNNYWLIRTSFPEIDMRGGRRYIIINAVNAEVMAIWAFQ